MYNCPTHTLKKSFKRCGDARFPKGTLVICQIRSKDACISFVNEQGLFLDCKCPKRICALYCTPAVYDFNPNLIKSYLKPIHGISSLKKKRSKSLTEIQQIESHMLKIVKRMKGPLKI